MIHICASLEQGEEAATTLEDEHKLSNNYTKDDHKELE